MMTREELEARAKVLKLKVPGNIGDEKLRERIEAAEKAAAEAQPFASGGTVPPEAGAPGVMDAAGAEPEGPSITVVGPAKGFRRAGHQFGAEPVTLALADLSEAQLEAIVNETRLMIAYRRH